MAYHKNLKDLFAAIADAIRAKTGSDLLLTADDFPSAIEGIEDVGSYYAGWRDGFITAAEWTGQTWVECYECGGLYIDEVPVCPYCDADNSSGDEWEGPQCQICYAPSYDGETCSAGCDGHMTCEQCQYEFDAVIDSMICPNCGYDNSRQICPACDAEYADGVCPNGCP